MTEPVELALLEVEGKLYLNAAAWPVVVYVDRVAVKKVDPRRIVWDGQNLKLWLDNGNAVYTLAPDDDGKDDIVTLHRKVASDVGEVPGRPAPDPAVPEPIVVAKSALAEVGFQMPRITQLEIPVPEAGPVTSPFTSDLTPYIFSRALSDARGMGGGGDALSTGAANFHGLMHPTGGNAAGYGNVRYFTSQDPFPVTPYRDLHHLQQEVDTMRAKLVSALEMQHTQYLMESPASAALALDSSASRWRTFLTDIGGYLNFVQGICQKLATMSYKNAQGEESRVWLTEPLAAQGRLSQFEWVYQSERQPKEVTLKEMMGEMGRAAEFLGGQATSLLGIVAPSRLPEKGSAPTPQDASEAEDARVLEEVDALTAMIGEKRYPGEWPVQSTSAAAFVRQEAWEKWAKEEAGADELDTEDAVADKAPDVPYERNWDDPGNGGNGQMGGDDGG